MTQSSLANDFYSSKTCTERKSCVICRDAVKGVEWRQLICRVHNMVDLNFSCTAGLPWVGGAPVAKPTPKPAVAGSKLQDVFNAYEKLLASLPATNVLVPVLRAIDAAYKTTGGCRGCRQRKLMRALVAAYGQMSDDMHKQVDGALV